MDVTPIQSDPVVDPAELRLVGDGTYMNLRPAQAYGDVQGFRITPVAVPRVQLVILNIIFMAFFTGFHLLVRHLRPDTPWPLLYLAPFGIGLMTCLLVTVITIFVHRRAQRLGPWLIYDRQQQTIALPREGETFHLEEVVRLQAVRGWRTSSGHRRRDELSELHLITQRDGERQRWRLLNGIGGFKYLLRPAAEHLPVPIITVRERWFRSGQFDVRAFANGDGGVPL